MQANIKMSTLLYIHVLKNESIFTFSVPDKIMFQFTNACLFIHCEHIHNILPVLLHCTLELLYSMHLCYEFRTHSCSTPLNEICMHKQQYELNVRRKTQIGIQQTKGMKALFTWASQATQDNAV